MWARCAAATGLIVAVVLCPLESASAAEVDVHYHATFKIALADSWTWDQASVIASASQAIDANKATSRLQPWHPTMYLYHAISVDPDVNAVAPNADVRARLSNLSDSANNAITQARTNPPGADKDTRALIAIGVQQHYAVDQWSHLNYGDVLGLGHTLQTAVDSIFNRTNPDHPAYRPNNTNAALSDALSSLDGFQLAWHDVHSDIADSDLAQLKAALTNENTLWMTDASRLGCNTLMAEHWLYLKLKQKNKLDKVPAGNVQPLNIAGRPNSWQTVYNQVFPGESAADQNIVVEPTPACPILNSQGVPTINPDGTYITVASAGTFDLAVTNTVISSRGPQMGGSSCAYSIGVTVSNNGPSTSPAFLVGVSIASSAVLSGSVEVPPLGRSSSTTANLSISGPCYTNYTSIAEVAPPSSFDESINHWDDLDISNDGQIRQWSEQPTLGFVGMLLLCLLLLGAGSILYWKRLRQTAAC